MPDQLLPTQGLHASLALEPVRIMTAQEIKQASPERLKLIESYYHNCLEALAGKQIWLILEALTQVEEAKRKK